MGKRVNKVLSIVLSLALIMMLTTTQIFAVDAANDQKVITGASYEGGSVKISDTTVSLTLPYNSSDTTVNVDRISFIWASGLTENTIDWEEGYETVAIDSSIQGTFNYKVSGSEEAFSTVYTVKVGKAEPVPAAASGTITKTVLSGKSVSFSSSDFEKNYKKNDGRDLASVEITKKDELARGEFSISEEAYSLGDKISYSDLSKLSFTSSVSGDMEYTVSYYESGNDESVGSAKLTIAVNNPEIPEISAGTMTQKETKSFPVAKVNSSFKAVTGKSSDFSIIEFSTVPSSSTGTLYKGYKSSSDKGSAIVAGNKFTLGDFLGSDIVFVPNATFKGNADIKYFVYDDNDEKYSGKVSFTVTSSTPEAIKETIATDETYSFSKSTINSRITAVGGNTVEYIKLTELPSTSKGYIYYDDSSKVTSTSTAYYYSGSSTSKKYINKLSFKPSGSTGTATIKYKAYDVDGKSYDGTITISIIEQQEDLANISYSVAANKTLDFSVSDFKNVLSKKTSKSLNYVKFKLPSTSYGIMYYDYKSSSNYDSKVSASTKYYASGSGELISNITFVPKSTYKGSFYIEYTAYNSSGTSYTGKVKITVKDTSNQLDEIVYKTAKDTDLDFVTSDFTKALDKVSNESLNYVYFELPSMSQGTLYYDYDSNQLSYTKVSSSTKYYRTGSGKNLIGKITFVPKSGYTGSFTLDYTAYDSDGEKFEGEITIKVGATDKLDNIAYTISDSKPLTLSASDINTKFKKVAGEDFSYVKFTLPSSTYGYLYYDYKNSQSKGSFVKSNEKYYRTGSGVNIVDKVSFEPSPNYSGVFDLKYTAYAKDGSEYTGIIKITVSRPAYNYDASKYFKDVKQDYSWAAGKIDYLYERGIVKGTESGANGMNYSPAAKITRGDFILMLYRAFNLKASQLNGNFSDVPSGSYYYDAIAVAKALGIAQGAYNSFNPAASLTREDAMVLLYRTIKTTGAKTLSVSSDVSRFNDRNSISSYAAEAVGTLVKAGAIKGYEDGTFAPKGLLTRAEMAVVLYNVEML